MAVVGYRVTTCYRLSRYMRWEEKDGGTGGREKSRAVRDKRVRETGEKIVHTHAAKMRHLMAYVEIEMHKTSGSSPILFEPALLQKIVNKK